MFSPKDLMALEGATSFPGGAMPSEKPIVSFAINNVARQIMTTYSLLFIDANERIGRSTQIECPTDEQAIDIAAQEPGDYKAIQVWNGDRPIVLIGNPRRLGEGLFAPVP